MRLFIVKRNQLSWDPFADLWSKSLDQQTGGGQSPATGIQKAEQTCSHRTGLRSGQAANNKTAIQSNDSREQRQVAK